MFFGTSRPVPSPAAARRLYQLAYISSGTAAGLAALCAEERRRQTAIVQRIADNAHRIRQSPRYRRHHAAADAGARGREIPPILPAASAPELPSAAEPAAHEQLADQTRAPPGQSHQRQSQSQRHHRQSQSHHPPPPQHPEAKDDASAHTPPVEPARQQQPVAGMLLPVPHDHAVRDSVTAPETPALIRRTVPRVPDGRPLVRRLAVEPKLPRKTVAREIEAFLHPDPRTRTASRAAARSQSRAATRLLSAALDLGILGHARSLFLWQASKAQLTGHDLQRICERAEQQLLHSEVRRDWLEFYEHVFQSAPFRETDEEFRAAAILNAAAIWTKTVDRPEMSKATRFGIAALSPMAMERPLGHICRHMVSDGDGLKMAHFVRAVCKPHGILFPRLHDEVLSYAIEHSATFMAIELISTKLAATKACVDGSVVDYTATEDSEALRQLDRIVVHCGQSKLNARLAPLLVDLSSHPLRQRWVFDLSPQARMHLAIAVGELHNPDPPVQDLCERLRGSVPPEFQQQIDRDALALKIWRTWSTTYDLDAVLRVYETTKSQASQEHPADTLASSESALLEICTLAKQPDRALAALRIFQEPGHHSEDSFSLIAVALSEKSSWQGLEQILQAGAGSDVCATDPAVVRRLNRVIELYCKHHGGADSTKFVISLVERLGFVPDATTTRTLLLCFVARKDLALIYQWEQYLGSIGLELKIDGRLAASMLGRFWEEQKPPSVLFIWLCRRLCSFAGLAFDGADFMYILRRAAAYDIRKVDAKDTLMKLYMAIKNLERITAAQGAIPRPMTKADYELLQKGHKLPCADVSAKTLDIGDQVVIDSFAIPVAADDRRMPASGGSAGTVKDGEATATSYVPFDWPDMRDEGAGHHQEPDHNHALQKPADKALEIRSLRLLRRYFAQLDDEDSVESQTFDDNTPEDMSDQPFPSCELISKMNEEFSMRRFQRVLDLYVASCVNGMPPSPLALQVAVEASIRLHSGKTTAAKEMIAQAKDAGFNVSSAIGPILIHDMYHSPPAARKDAEALRRKVIGYYRVNDENGCDVGEHVGVTAAHILINNGRAEHGINLLDAMFQSEWARHRSLGMVPLTIYLKGYAALAHKAGVEWVVRRVLSTNLFITRKFLGTLAKVEGGFYKHAREGDTDAESREALATFGRQIRLLLNRCRARRAAQKTESARFARALMHTIRGIELKRKGLRARDVESPKERDAYRRAVTRANGWVVRSNQL